MGSERSSSMCSFNRVFIAAFILANTCNHVFAEQKFSVSGAVSLPPPAQTQNTDKQRDDNKPQTPDCARSNVDSRCNPPQPPHYYPHPHRPRPVIVNQLPPQPAIETNSLTDDWEGCRKAKLGWINARERGDSDQANHLDEWLWRNCRTYSNELRQLEQNDM